MDRSAVALSLPELAQAARDQAERLRAQGRRLDVEIVALLEVVEAIARRTENG